tara:strand:- start:399 stop:998 length:600 start_codon:yes stop_codon:yes gene_type:complete
MRYFLKRIFDLSFSLLVIIFTSPLLLLIAISVFILDGKPVFFVHERVGLNFKKIFIYKFRTMRSSSRKEKGFDAGNTERVTNFGFFLRKYKLDELPQFFNVLKGDLSVVGPRPETEYWINKNISSWKEILQFKPGLTDNASIMFSNEEYLLSKQTDPKAYYREEILPKKIAIYKEYVESNSFWGDILIIFKTIYKIVTR